MAHQDPVPNDRRSPPGTNSVRTGADLLLGWLAGTTLAPFVQALVTRGADDLYTKLRRHLGSADRARAQRQIAEKGELILVDEAARAVLRMPSTIRADEAYALAAAHAPLRNGNEWIMVEWNEAASRWTLRRLDTPPADGITTGTAGPHET